MSQFKFYIILKGIVDILRDGVCIATLREDDYFGEGALLVSDCIRIVIVVVVVGIIGIVIVVGGSGVGW